MRLPTASIYVPYSVALGYGATVELDADEAAVELLELLAGREVREAAESVAASVGLDEGAIDSERRTWVRVRSGGWDRTVIVRSISAEVWVVSEILTRPNNHRGARRDNRGRRR